MFTRKPSLDQPPHKPATSQSGPIGRASLDTDAGAGKAPASPTKAQVGSEEGLVTIGKGTRVTGKIGDCRVLDVYGSLEADVVAENVIVRAGGGIKGTIQTDTAEIHGVVEGSLMVHGHLDIRGTGQVSGEFTYETLAVEKGAKVLGAIQCHEQPVETPDVRPMAEIVPLNGVLNGSGHSAAMT